MASVTNWNQIPNSEALKRTFAGVEVQAGVPVTPTAKWYGDLKLNPKRPMNDREEYAGTFFGDYSVVLGPWEVDGTYEQALSYEDLPMLLRHGLVGGVAGVTDGNTTPGYLYEHKPTPDVIDLDAATVENGQPGMPFRSSCLIFPEFTIKGDIDNAAAAWEWSSRVLACTQDLIASVTDAATSGTTSTITKTAAGWTINQFAGAYVRMTGGTAQNVGQFRRILSNTATVITIAGVFPAAVAAADTFEISGMFTGSVSDRVRETIAAPGTKLYIDGTTLGSTQQLLRFISFEVTYMGNVKLKRFMENVDSYAPMLDQGKKRVRGSIRLEFASRDEWDAWKAAASRKIRIRQTGSVIDSVAATTKYAQIDIFDARWTDLTPDKRDNNLTKTLGFKGLVDATEASPFEIIVKNKNSANP
jgi:hypothetical protein